MLVLACLPLAKRDDKNIWPAWLQWLNTWDDPGDNQGEYEPQVVWWYVHFGWEAKTWYWLGWRNQAYGLFHALAPVLRFYDPTCVFTRRGNWLLVEQDGKLWFDYVRTFSVGSKNVTFTCGWKLRTITQYLDGSDKGGHGLYDRPGFDLQLRIKSK